MMYLPRIAIGILIFISNNAYAQNNGVVIGGIWSDQISVSDVNGRPFENKYPDVNGSPWFNPEYKLSKIILNDGKKFSGIRSKINLANQQLAFITGNNVEAYLETGQVKEVLYADTLAGAISSYKFQTGFPSVDKLNGQNFYQVLADGKCMLLQSIVKEVKEDKNEFSGEIAKEFKTIENLYFYINEEMKRVKKNKDFILSVLKDKASELTQFIQSEKINCNNNEQLIRLVEHYNSLP